MTENQQILAAIQGLQNQINGMGNQINGLQSQMTDVQKELREVKEQGENTHEAVVLLENELLPKVNALFDGYSLNRDLNKINSEKIDNHEVRINKLEIENLKRAQ